jgi:hypothetical protein
MARRAPFLVAGRPLADSLPRKAEKVSVTGGPPETVCEGAPAGSPGPEPEPRRAIVFGGRVGARCNGCPPESPRVRLLLPRCGRTLQLSVFPARRSALPYTSTGGKPGDRHLCWLAGRRATRTDPARPSPAIYVPAALRGKRPPAIPPRRHANGARLTSTIREGRGDRFPGEPGRKLCGVREWLPGSPGGDHRCSNWWVDRSGTQLESVDPLETLFDGA